MAGVPENPPKRGKVKSGVSMPPTSTNAPKDCLSPGGMTKLLDAAKAVLEQQVIWNGNGAIDKIGEPPCTLRMSANAL
jgi:hypothetical protein